MKKITAAVFCMLISAAVYAAEPMFSLGLVRAGGGYAYLLEPKLDDIEAIPGSEVTKGGASASLQGYFGKMFGKDSFLWGLEVGYQRTYNYEFPALTTEATFTSYPLMVAWEYDFGRRTASIMPFLQWAAGVSIDSVKVESGGVSETTTNNDFVFAAGPGLAFKLTEKVSLDTLLRYHLFFTGADYTHTLNLTLNLGFQM